MLDNLRRRVANWLHPAAVPFAPATESRSISADGSGDFAGIFAASTLSGSPVNERTALGITAVWRAVNLYANTIAALSLYVAERDDRGGRRHAVNHPAYDLLHCRPNGYTTSFNFRQSQVGHALTHGNSYAEIQWDAKGRRAVALHLMDPRYVEPELSDDRVLLYRNTQDGTEFPAEDVIHIHGFGWDGIKGYSPISIARETLGVAAAQQRWEAGVYGNNAQASGHIEMPGSMNTKQQSEFRENWNAIHQGTENAGKVGILTGGAKWVQTSFSPADAQLLLSKGFSVAEVARLFGCPPHMLGQMDGATFSNIEEQNIQFLQLSLVPWLKSIEQELDVKLFGRQERQRYFTRHDVNSLMRGNMAARSGFNRAMFDMGARSINEIRLDEGDNPLDDPRADMHWIPVNNLAAIETMDGSPTQPAVNTEPDPATAVPNDGPPADEVEP